MRMHAVHIRALSVLCLLLLVFRAFLGCVRFCVTSCAAPRAGVKYRVHFTMYGRCGRCGVWQRLHCVQQQTTVCLTVEL